MKKLLVILLCAISINAISQTSYDKWVDIPYVDDFERSTGDTATVNLSKGKFSNSATVNNTKFTAKFILDKKSETISINLFEYNRGPSARMAYRNSFGMISCLVTGEKTPRVFKKVFAPKSGGLYITKRDNPDLYALITTKKEISFLVKGSMFDSSRSSTSYSFTLISN